ncbi:lipoprotein-anchoring transpeptidase ErfK/SrfK [Micromonospora pisi]|uniref:Lipoprotein-anchoring transpeptidase ErfK/SrfK n=1 Tax=Micromonospora pisi TaxID=589240 RepID=A0A495JNH0_9ACTN|nr:Ig-like domain-containing protein [Micromonospora pisi]RKR90537.1 lipoprotein-anchoring transpeptidase ErfK/SrfK [Micromonospora pisi]
MRASRDQLMRQTARRRRATARTLVTVVLTGVLALAAGCSSGGGGNSPAWQGGKAPELPKASAVVTSPAADAKDVPASTEISFGSKDATETKFELKDGAGKVVEGKVNAEGTSFLPSGALEYGTTYTATVTATGDDGKPATVNSSFTTMAKPANQVRVTSFLGDGSVVGVGMPAIVQFSRAIPEEYRDDLQRRMTVTTTPPQEGSWRWISPTEVHYRPKTFWKANTELDYKIQAGGLPLGDGWYGRADLTIDAKIGPAVVMTVDNKTKKMTVTKDGKVLKTFPISLGKPSTPSSSGTMIVMEKLRKTVFDTMDDPKPENRYKTDIEYAQRLTWGGEFIHAAPWSVAQQGHTNVSHGCVNMSQENAAWLFGVTTIGDPITVKGTEVQLKNGNGWTDWNMSWDEYIKGSAIPYEPPSADEPAGADPSSTPTN